MPRAAGVGQLALQHHVWREGVGFLASGLFLVQKHIRVDVGEVRRGNRLAQKRQAVVELVVAQVGGVVAKLVHHFVGRVHFARFQGLDLGHVIAQWVALQQIAVVKQEAVGRFAAGGFDERYRAREAILVGRLVLVVVIRHQVHVQIGGLHEAQLDLGAVGAGRGHDQQQGRPAQGVFHGVYPSGKGGKQGASQREFAVYVARWQNVLQISAPRRQHGFTGDSAGHGAACR